MPYRTIETLTSWVAEFEEQNPAVASAIHVIPQDGAQGADTGLVAMRILNSPTEIYIEPPTEPDGEWTITFEPRNEYVRLGSSDVQVMATEVSDLAKLCAFLQHKSDEVWTSGPATGEIG